MLNYNMLTQYAEGMDRQCPLPEYPRPQLKRDSFMNLNGQWEYTIPGRDVRGTILVPFPPESCLSGVGMPFALKKQEELVYTRSFTVEPDFLKEITLLHIGAVDQCCAVFVNDIPVGRHEGGYLPADFIVSDAIRPGVNTLTVRVRDPLSYLYPTGKQRKKRGSIWYTPVSGIWQTVWLESVGKNYVQSLRFTPDVDRKSVRVELDSKAKNWTLTVSFAGETVYHGAETEGAVEVSLAHALHLWSPENPALYQVTVETEDDLVTSYFAMRKFTAENGVFHLNGQPYFVNGLLDQGYFSDGIYTPASYDAYRDDILQMKELGYNTLRKHIKIEPMLFYYYCDTLGMLVFQDMVNIGKYSKFKDGFLALSGLCKKLPYRNVNRKQMDFFRRHAEATLDYLYSVPSLVYYTIFNEGWGQFDGDGMYTLLRAKDPTRVYDATSGWFKETLSDVYSDHVYFRKILPPQNPGKPWIVSEFGGYSHPCAGHLFNNEKRFGYGNCDSLAAFEERFLSLYEREILGNLEHGLAGAIYTQVSDVEDEVNGLLTYDRRVCKLQPEPVRTMMKRIEEAFRVIHP